MKTNTVNGYSFGPSAYTATAGANTITLTATGTPLAAGTNSFNIDFGDGQTCSFTITVGNAAVTNNDYFPTTQGSYWTYDDVPNSDTFKVTVNGSTVIGGNTYQKFIYSDAGGSFFTEYYRKDTTIGFYYQSYDTTDYPEFGQAGIVFSQKKFDVLFLKNVLSPGASWTSDVNNVTLGGTPGGTLRFAFQRISSTPTLTVNGKTFSNFYKIQSQIQAGFGSNLQSIGSPYYYYYVQGVGLVLVEDQNGNAQQAVRYWHVN